MTLTRYFRCAICNEARCGSARICGASALDWSDPEPAIDLGIEDSELDSARVDDLGMEGLDIEGRALRSRRALPQLGDLQRARFVCAGLRSSSRVLW